MISKSFRLFLAWCDHTEFLYTTKIQNLNDMEISGTAAPSATKSTAEGPYQLWIDMAGTMCVGHIIWTVTVCQPNTPC